MRGMSLRSFIVGMETQIEQGFGAVRRAVETNPFDTDNHRELLEEVQVLHVMMRLAKEVDTREQFDLSSILQAASSVKAPDADTLTDEQITTFADRYAANDSEGSSPEYIVDVLQAFFKETQPRKAIDAGTLAIQGALDADGSSA